MTKSPCVNQCTLDADNICVGCRRTRREIAMWNRLPDYLRIRILNRVNEKLTQIANEE